MRLGGPELDTALRAEILQVAAPLDHPVLLAAGEERPRAHVEGDVRGDPCPHVLTLGDGGLGVMESLRRRLDVQPGISGET